VCPVPVSVTPAPAERDASHEPRCRYACCSIALPTTVQSARNASLLLLLHSWRDIGSDADGDAAAAVLLPLSPLFSSRT
jgi:hypothetical protein